ncbi:hypothetical protein Cgig2_024246 [Carnegiea gigantea]|uniref:Uncharacterized protein n=1 Tax=Carnegiea gigantea TaxID=171969 RepID=A0A9Q1Q9N9_9CARY|nr:hypothetical protein Cgig2_024246 [Carnegiea gigantea]
MYANKGSLLESQLRQWPSPGDAQGSVNGREESSGSNNPPPPYSDEGRMSKAGWLVVTLEVRRPLGYLPLTVKGGGEASSVGDIQQISLAFARQRWSTRRKMILFPNFTSTEEAAEHVRDTFRWSLRESLAFHQNPLPEGYHGLCSGFDLDTATRYAYDSNIPEMVHAIFYTMDYHELHNVGPTLPRLNYHGPLAIKNRAKAPRLANPPANPAALSNPVEDSGLSDAPLASNDEE